MERTKTSLELLQENEQVKAFDAFLAAMLGNKQQTTIEK